MAYNIYNPCDQLVEAPVVDACLSETELGRVRGIAYIHKSVIAAIKADPDDPALWAARIANGTILVIPETSGTFDGGAPVEVPGYGNTETKLIGFKFQISYKDPNLKGNTPFYNTIKKAAGQYYVAFCTETLTRISDKPCTVLPKAPVEEGMDSQVVWNVDVKFNGEDQPVPFDTPTGVFG